jgi:hypothetical protein
VVYGANHRAGQLGEIGPPRPCAAQHSRKTCPKITLIAHAPYRQGRRSKGWSTVLVTT